MKIKGKIPNPRKIQSLPIQSSLYELRPDIERNYRGLQNLSFIYESDGEIVAQLLPDCFEIEEAPTVTFSFSQTDYSLAGAYLMANLAVEVSHENLKLKLDLRQFITSTVPIVVGRELLGVAKVDGQVEINRGPSSPLVSAKLFRPSEHLLATAVFQPTQYHGEQARSISHRIGVRAMPGLSMDGDPDICELTRFESESWGAELWTGRGTLKFTEASDIDPIHLAPVRRMLECRYSLGGWSRTTISRGGSTKL